MKLASSLLCDGCAVDVSTSGDRLGQIRPGFRRCKYVSLIADGIRGLRAIGTTGLFDVGIVKQVLPLDVVSTWHRSGWCATTSHSPSRLSRSGF